MKTMVHMRAARKRRDILGAEARQILDTATRAGRELTAEENDRYDALAAQLTEADREVDDAQAAFEAELAGMPRADSAGIDMHAPYAQRSDTAPARRTATPAGPTRYASLFPGEPVANDGWRSSGEFLANLAHHTSDPRLRFLATSGNSAGIGSDGGYLVPTNVSAGIIDHMLEASVVLPYARVVGMDTPTQRFPTFDNSTAASGTVLGGLSANWAAEGETLTAQKPKLRTLELHARKLQILVPATSELLADATGFQNSLEVALRDAAAWFIDRALVVGSGAGEPVGIIGAASTISVAKADSQDAATFLYDNAIAMWGRLAPQCARNARWLVHPTTLPQLLQMVLPIGVGGVPITVLKETDGVMSLLGRPVDISEKCQPLGTVGDVVLYDPSQIIVGIHKAMTVDSSAHTYFDSDQIAFRLTVRLDAQPTWQSAHTMPDGSNTVSWAVTCETRA